MPVSKLTDPIELVLLQQGLYWPAILDGKHPDVKDLSLVQFPDLPENSNSEAVAMEIKKAGVQKTTPNFFVAFANNIRGDMKEGQVLNSLIPLASQKEHDNHNWLYITKTIHNIGMYEELDSSDTFFGPNDYFVVEKKA